MRYATMLSCLVALSGSVASVQASIFTLEARLVVDGDFGAPTGPGVDTYLPSSGATRVGLTVQARLRQNESSTLSGVGNYGVGGVQSPTTTNQSRFTHNDTVYSGGTYQPFARGRTGTVLGADGRVIAGTFGPDSGRNFRAGAINTGSSAADWNTERTNAPGANGTNAASGNGYFPATGAELYRVQSVVSTLGSDLGTAPLFAVGEFSPWYNLYRVYFDPSAAGGEVRDVTVSFYGRFLGVTRFVATPASQYTLGNPSGATGGIVDTTVSATFQVPAPGAAVLLGLGGLVAGRRRRGV